jgi:NAD(P)-dependent dehydrogenase (short-subunit alcohol dehydrogenase family)
VGLCGTPFYLVYGCSKAAVAYFVDAAAAERVPWNIRVNGIGPRADTRMMADATERLMQIALPAIQSPREIEAAVAALLRD